MIVKLTKGELKIIQKMANEIWPICFKEMISESQITYMLHWMYNLKTLEDNFQKGHQFIVFKKDNLYIGFASFELRKYNNSVRLHKLYVDPSNQNKGTGRVLLNFVINEGRNAQISKLDLFVNRSNPAVLFYKKLGFKSIGSVDLEIGNGFYMNDYRMEVEI